MSEDTAVPLATTSSTDATLNEMPVLPSERIFGFWGYSSVNVSYAVATWAFLQGAAVAYYVGAVEAIATMVIGYGISIFLVSIAPCLPSAKYGVEQYIGLRSVFGHVGARIVMVAFSTIFAAVWAAILSIMFAHGVTTVATHLLGSEVSEPTVMVIVFALLAIAMSWGLLARGPMSLERTSSVVAPLMGVVIVVLMVLILKNHPWSELASLPPLEPMEDHHVSFMLALELAIAGGFNWWPNMGNLARLTKSPRVAFWPNWIGIYFASIAASTVGVLAALVLQLEEPNQWMVPLVGVAAGLIAVGICSFANITAIVTTTYTAMIALRGGGGKLFRTMAWPVMLVIILGPALVLVLFPAQVYNNYGRFLSWSAIFIAPLCAVQLVDYTILRKSTLNLRHLYITDDRSCYFFWRGVNPVAFAALAAGGVTYALILNPVTYEPTAAFGLMTASIPSFVVAGLVYYVLTVFISRPARVGGYHSAV